jgi:hypothetical protein
MSIVTYEDRLNASSRWAFMEGSMHFEKGSSVHKTLTKIARRLEELRIPYAVVGGMAMFFHGFRRFTEDVDILVTRDALKRIHEELEGRGYVPPFGGSKNLRDAESGVKIEFLVTGGFPGDGQPKPVAFPDPTDVYTVIDDVRFVTLPKLIELKLASGMTHPLRGKDLVDIQELISTLQLDEKLAEELNPYVREKYLEIWRLVRDNPIERE